MKIVKLAAVILLMLAEAGAIFVAQLYSPTVLWVVSFALLIGAIILGIYVKKRVYRLASTLIFSLIINANFLFHIPYGNPVGAMLLYGLGLTILSWALLFFITEITANILSQGQHSRDQPPASGPA